MTYVSTKADEDIKKAIKVNHLRKTVDRNISKIGEIIKRAQERLWSPYFKAFDSTNTHQDFTMSNLFPLYIG